MKESALTDEPGWWSDCWLHATTEEFDLTEIRSYWNGDEPPAIRSLRVEAPLIELGPLFADSSDHLDVGPARRIFDLLFLRGTTPDYVLPVVDDDLVSEIVRASLYLADDRVTSVATPEEIEAFLSEHRGWRLVVFES